jgi:riboflavin kinase/FMN adenylyltransferase
VYAARVEWRGGQAGGMLNQGPKPTFGDTRRTVEVHLFGVDEDLYGEWVRVEWVERLREVQRFTSVDQLQDQLKRDRAEALDALARHAPMMDQSRASHA